jgi:hypothetical protein
LRRSRRAHCSLGLCPLDQGAATPADLAIAVLAADAVVVAVAVATTEGAAAAAVVLRHRAAVAGRRTPGGGTAAVAWEPRRDCGSGLGTAAGNRSRLNGDGGAAVLRRLSGSWTGENLWRREWLGENLLHSVAGRIWRYSVVLEVDKPRRGGNMRVGLRNVWKKDVPPT